MASTIPPSAAFDFAKIYVKNMPLQDVSVRILDNANKILWMAAPWRWSIGTLTAITITSNTQDYTLAPPSDFLYLLHSYVTNGVEPTRDIKVVPTLPAAVGVKGMTDFIAYQGSNTFRISPNPGTQKTPASQIFSFYKKQAPIIKASNANTPGVLVLDDEWFHVYEACVLWQAFLYGEDQRAGACQFSNRGEVQYTGQRAIFEAAILNMKAKEPMPYFNFPNNSETPQVNK